ncbi:MAG: Translation initiation factor 2 [Labilithrix sp.]|nr:Translation initiation factor 2 [Labilithrix sp.]
MTMRLDIVSNDAGEFVRREHARELGAGVVIAIYRLAKLAQLHDLANQAFIRQLEQTHQVIGDYCLRSGSNVNVLFANRAIFVAGQLLKGSRHTYECAIELGELFERLGGSELFIARDLTREELLAFAEQISNSYRGMPFVSPTPKVRLRPVADSARLRGMELEDLTDDQRIVRMYASAVVIMRRFYEDLQASRYILPRRVKRIAQSLVDLSDGSTPAFLGVTEVRNANFDEAGRGVNTAILAVTLAREVTEDRSVLSQIAMAAMMHDVARPRAMALSQAAGPAMPGMAGPTTLSEDQEDRLPAGSAAVLTALGRVNEPSITRTVLAFEALWLRRQTWLGPVYWGARPSTLHARIITVARRYNDLLTPEPGLPPPTPDFAVATLSEELKDPQDRTVLRMLVAALGLLPMGTVVQLTTGEVAEVVRGPRGLADKARIRLVMDANGQALEPHEIELAEDPQRAVARVMSVDGWRKGLEHGPGIDVEAYGDERESDPPAAEAPPPRSIADQYADRYASWGEDDKQPRTHTPGRPESSSIQSSEQPSSASLPSMGSSPSAVAEAMGRMINDSLRPPTMPPRADERTLLHGADPRAGDAAPAEGAPRASRSVRPTREPSARGTLAATPLPHVLVYMLDHALTGTVLFESEGGDDILYFVAGVPTKIRLHDPVALLGQILVHGGAIETAAVEQAVEGARRLGVLLGEYLVGHDLVSREALSWALEAQLLNKVAYLANLPPEVSYSYFRDLDLLESWGGGDVPVGCALNPILASVRNWMDRGRVRATLNRIGKHPLIVHEDADLTNLALLPDEQATLEAILQDQHPLAHLFKRNIADEEVVSSLVYTLAVTRQFAFKGQKKGPMAPRAGATWKPTPSSGASSNSSAPSASGSVPAPSNSAVKAAAPVSTNVPAARQVSAAPAPRPMQPAVRPSGGLPRANPPQIRPMTAKKATIVGVQPSSPPEARRSLGPAAQPSQHPSATPPDGARTIARPSPGFAARGGPPSRAPVASGVDPGRSVAPGEPKATPPSGRSGLAQVLGSPPPPRVEAAAARPGEIDFGAAVPDTDHAIDMGDAGLADAEAALEAMQSFRSAEAALQKNDLAAAQQLAQRAVQGDPTQADYLSLLAWVKALSGSASTGEAVMTMSNILHDEPSNERALLYRGKLLARSNRLAEAVMDFTEILAGNPHHREAQTELRAAKAKLG